MKISQLKKQIKGVFKQPKKKYYLGKLNHGTPYFYPMNFNSSIIAIRKLELKSAEETEAYNKKYTHLKGNPKSLYSNLPMVRRNKEWILKVFNNNYLIQIGWPVYITWYGLGWKDKYSTPRFEWAPSFQIYFFNWQFCIWWIAPIGYDDNYYEQILWFINYSNCDIKVAEETWGWSDYKTKISTWNKNFLL